MLAVHFGAGNIGRGFIGLLLSQSGYEVAFVDVNKALVEELNQRKAYDVQLAEADAQPVHVQGVRGIDGTDLEQVASTIATANLVTTAVGPHVLPHIAAAIAAGISRRLAHGAEPLNVIACENMIGGSAQLKEHVYGHLTEAERTQADAVIGFPNAAVDRIVPLQHHEDKLLVTVEPFYEWVVDRSQMKGEIPAIQGVTYVDDLAPYIERKLFTVNTGHAVIAYLGYQKGCATIDEAMRDGAILASVQGALRETGALLVAKYGFDQTQHEHYIAKILGRYANPLLPDEVTRVGRSPIRKLSPNDRLVGPAMQCMEKGIVPAELGRAIAAALLFDYREDSEAAQLQKDRQELGIEQVLREYTHIPPGHPLETIVLQHVQALEAKTETN